MPSTEAMPGRVVVLQLTRNSRSGASPANSRHSLNRTVDWEPPPNTVVGPVFEQEDELVIRM